jgi:acyl-CoA synthetase (AMP-forming)/AMP-acid ligase II
MSGWEQVLERTWVDVFVEQTDRHAARPMAREGDRVLTYGELRRRVDELAWGLAEDGVRAGETIAVWMNNSLEFVIAQWAAYRLGCTLLPLYSYYRVPELEHCLHDAHVTTLVTKADFSGKVDARSLLLELLPELAEEGAAGFARAPSLRRVLTVEPWELPGTRTVDEVARPLTPRAEAALAWMRERIAPLDVMHVMFTSGTTGAPKGGLSMHANNLATVHLWTERARLTADDVLLCHVPLFTNFGCLYASGLAVYAGASIVITPFFDAQLSLDLIARHGVTYVPGSPEIFRGLLEADGFDAADVSTVRGGHVAGSSLDPELMGRIIDRLAPEVIQAYGMSECGGIAAITTADDPRELRLTTIGRPVPSCVLEIRDPDTGLPVDTGVAGEIWFADAVPGSCVGKGYFGDAALTAAAITPDGWFRSGDLGYYGADGHLRFTGRRKNMITVGGFNVYPQEVERFLAGCDGVAEAHVVGVPDHRLGTVPVAFLVAAAETTLDVAAIEAAAAQALSSQKRPRAYWTVRRDQLPYTPSGKVQTGALEDEAAARRAAVA